MCCVANLSKTLHTNFYQNRSTLYTSVGVFFMAHSVGRLVVVVEQWSRVRQTIGRL